MSPHRIIHTLIVFSIAAGAFVLPGRAPVDAAPPVEPELTALAEWGIDIFTEADLHLPDDLVVEWDTTLAYCDGAGGRYSDRSTKIVMCATEDRPTTRRTLLHELAHAWEAASLSEDRRDAYQQHKGLPTWLDHDHAWGHRAGEHVAEIIAWGVTSEGTRLVSVAHDGCTALAEEFEWLTGTPPPAGLPERCAPEVPVTTTTFAGGLL